MPQILRPEIRKASASAPGQRNRWRCPSFAHAVVAAGLCPVCVDLPAPYALDGAALQMLDAAARDAATPVAVVT